MLLINFLCAVSSLIFRHYLLQNHSLHLFVSVHFRSTCDSFFSFSHKGLFSFTSFPQNPLSFQIPSKKTMLLQLCHPAYNKMYIILFPTLSSSSNMHLKIIFCHSLYFSLPISLHLFIVFWYITLISHSLQFWQKYARPAAYNSSLKLATQFSHFRFTICQS